MKNPRFSHIEAKQERPSKQWCRRKSSSFEDSPDDEISDTEATDSAETSSEREGNTPNGQMISESDDNLLSEIAQEFDGGDDTGPNVSEKLTLSTSVGLKSWMIQNLNPNWKNTIDQQTALASLSLRGNMATRTPITDFIFGDDLQSQHSSITASNKIGQTTSAFGSGATPRRYSDSHNKSFKDKSVYGSAKEGRIIHISPLKKANPRGRSTTTSRKIKAR
ncbi:Hypothetical predicted protein [Paramuricea clavata]|uniref:Uncharacterized protein n=1 Tax=Paramuricea clavata TaxID=317549 RepID=A0A7D9DCE8_PARCT|nr:Hypothetical predicted protein [Paramuricea clavata]